MNIAAGIFLILHGLVHLLYTGHSFKLFELPGVQWPDNSWAFGKLLDNKAARNLAGVANIVAAIGFVAGGIGVFSDKGYTITAASAIFSAAIYILFWDGKPQKLAEKGIFAILINIVILILALING